MVGMAKGRGSKKAQEWPRVVSFEGAVVKVFRRGNGKFALSWREDGRRRTTTKTEEADAMKWATDKARMLGQTTGQRWVTPAMAEAIEALRRIAGPEEGAVGSLIAEVEAARGVLGSRADLLTAARWFIDYGPRRSEPLTVAEAGARFLKEYEGGSKATQRTFGTEVKAFMGEFGDRMLHEVTEPMLRAWVDRKTKPDNRKPAPRTVLSRITTLTTLLNRAKDWGVIPEQGKSAAERLRRPKLPSASRAIFTVEQARKLLKAVRAKEPKLETFLLLGGWLGLRPSEAVKVLAGDFDFKGGYLHATVQTVLKTGQERFVPMAPAVARRLKEIIAAKSPRERVCVYRSREYLSVLAREEGVVSTWPSDVLRHSFCSYRLAILGDVGRVAEEAGNSPKMIREHYRRPLKAEDGAAWWALLDEDEKEETQ